MTDPHETLRRSDPRLALHMERIGEIEITRSPVDFHTMVGVIVGQQLSGKAAETIRRRLCDGLSCPDGERLLPERFAGHSAESLRPFGLSRQKAGYILDLAEKTAGGGIAFDRFDGMSDDTIIKELTAVKGIGVWTVQMLLMFSLGREDVLPLNDLGIQNGFCRLDNLTEKPSNAYMIERAEIWRPYRTLACRYLWRIADAPAILEPI